MEFTVKFKEKDDFWLLISSAHWAFYNEQSDRFSWMSPKSEVKVNDKKSIMYFIQTDINAVILRSYFLELETVKNAYIMWDLDQDEACLEGKFTVGYVVYVEFYHKRSAKKVWKHK